MPEMVDRKMRSFSHCFHDATAVAFRPVFTAAHETRNVVASNLKCISKCLLSGVELEMSSHAPEELDVVAGFTNFVAIRSWGTKELEMPVADAAALQMSFQRRLGKPFFAADW